MISEAQLEFWLEFARKMNEALSPYIVDETRRLEEAAVRYSACFAPIATASHGSSGEHWNSLRRLYTVGRSERRKGVEAEREFARFIGGERVPLSGAAGGSYTGDVVGLGLRWEVKRRADGFRSLYDWLEGKDALAVRADRRPWLVVMPLDRLLELVRDREIP